MLPIKLYTPANFVTLANLICGCIGIQQALLGHLDNASYCIYLAAIFDFFDGFVARLFKSSSELGKQLDSLSDVVSFGVLPGFILYSLLEQYEWVALIVPACSALRLAKFNIDERQADSFIGVPTPINALFITSLAFVFQGRVIVAEINYILIGLTLLSSVLLVSEFSLLSLKFSNWSWKENVYRYLLFFVSVLFVVFLKQDGFLAIYFTYLVLSFVKNTLQTQ